MAATAKHRLTLDPMGKCSNAFFSETTNIIKAKLYMNVHWMVLYKFYVFCSDMKFKMAATAGLSLTLDPMGKMFPNASSLKPLGQLKPNSPGMIIGRSSTKFMFFMSIGNPRCEIQNGGYGRTCLTLDPMGKMFQNASSLKPNCPGMIIGRSSVFYADRKSKMAATTGHSINTGPYRENTEISSSLKLLH